MDSAAAFTIDELKPGMSADYSRTISAADVADFGAVSGDTNPLHFDEAFAETTIFKGRIVHGMLIVSFISAVLGTKLPGAGCIVLDVNIRFRAPVRIGDTVTATVTVREIEPIKRRVAMDCVCKVKDTIVIEGGALVIAPAKRT